MAPLLSEEELALGDPYEVLGVPLESTEKQIQSAYRKLSVKCHPDRVSTKESMISIFAPKTSSR
jgi:curved DNA-binding protein CbpA